MTLILVSESRRYFEKHSRAPDKHPDQKIPNVRLNHNVNRTSWYRAVLLLFRCDKHMEIII